MGSERAAALAADFAAANEAALQFAGSCSDADWNRRVPGEDWTVGVVLHHIAEGHTNGLRWLRSMASGEGVSETAEDIDNANAAARSLPMGHPRQSAQIGHRPRPR